MTATEIDYNAFDAAVQAIVEEGHPELSTNALSNLLDLATDGNTEEARYFWTTRLWEQYGVQVPQVEDFPLMVEDTTEGEGTDESDAPSE